ncbi:MAG: L-threonylcarbamoyladenylate synthase [Thermodesulfobacteriota bacterium]|nr:L-threonylcarbamoyladenylate synthase [Thermodesulfobacteriota bacterium]
MTQSDSLKNGLSVIAGLGCLIYPTETYFALGAGAFHAKAASRVFRLKAREKAKPLPLILGSLDQLSLVTSMRSPELSLLAEKFWPGPLSVLVPAVASLPREVQDARGLTSVRVTPHPTAAKLCLDARLPLIATSANKSGHPPAVRPEDLDPELCRSVDFVLDEPPHPGGGPASTVVGMEPGMRLVMYRQGPVSETALREAGFEIALK